MRVSSRTTETGPSSAACRRYFGAAAALLLVLALSPSVQAQRTPLACQVDEAAGLNWENGKWRVARFVLSRFILIREGSSITEESAAKVMKTSNIKCHSGFQGRITCNNELGGILFFDPITKQGAIAELLGAADSMNGYRDSVVVQPFTCQPF
jgi:hypothetical protein